MDLNDVALFAKVAKANSFSAAARQLNMPIATVSRRVAELENQLGICLLKRTTRSLHLTEIGSEVLEHAQRTDELREAISGVVARHQSDVSGILRLAAPPNFDCFLLPLVCAFQASYPQVRVQIQVAARTLERLEDDIDLAFGLEAPKDSLLVARKLLTYRHRLVASPAYLARYKPPEAPRDLLEHRLIAFSGNTAVQRATWEFSRTAGPETETLSFFPYLSINDFAALTKPLLAGAGIGEIPPTIHPELIRDRKLIEVMPQWQFRCVDLSLFHVRARHMPRAVRLFKEFATQLAGTVPAASW
jgi:DNA-binding transcriptional LysR family regulator